MSYKPPVESSIYKDLNFLYRKAVTCQKKKNNQQALFYYSQALKQIQSTDKTNRTIDELRYEICRSMCDIYIQQDDRALAYKSVTEALQIAFILQKWNEIT